MNATAPASYPRWAPWRRLALSVAIAALPISMIAIGMMSASFYERRSQTPLDNARIAALRQTYRQALEAGDATAADRISKTIRQVDVDVRETFFQQQRRMHVGAWLVLISVSVCMGSMKLWRKMGQANSMPPTGPPGPRSQWVIQRELAAARWAVVAMALLGASLCGGWVMAIRPISAPDESAARVNPATQWSRYHGLNADGRVAGANPPVQWDVRSASNIAWSVPLELPGHSSPIVWGNRVLISCADKWAQRLMCLSLSDGHAMWSAPVGTRSPESRHVTAFDPSVYAAPTPTTDGRRVYVMFASGDVAAFTLGGRLVWSIELGVPTNAYGHASSPVLCGDELVIQWDEQERHELIALDAVSGKALWRSPRRVGESWSTPTVIDAPGGRQIVTISIDGVVATNPSDGKTLWRVGGIGADADGAVAAAPIGVGGRVIVLNPYANAIWAIDPDRRDGGEATVVWKCQRDAELAALATPVSDGRRIYLIASDGFVCLDAVTGKVVWSHETDGDGGYAVGLSSSVLAGGRWYVPDARGVMWVLRADDAYEVLSRNAAGEAFTATPALSGGRLLIRTPTKLICIAAASVKAVSP